MSAMACEESENVTDDKTEIENNPESKKDSPAKKGSTPAAKSTPAAAAKKKEEKKEEKVEEKVEEEVEEKIEEELEAMDTSETVVETPKGRGGAKKGLEKERLVEDEATAEDEPKDPATPVPSDAELPEFDPDKFTPGYVPQSVKKGEHEYNIIVSGVKDTGLCGNYWNVSEGGRRRSKPPETLQMGKSERRGSVGSVGSEKSNKDSPAASLKKSASVATPKSSKKQVTRPESGAEEEAKAKEETKTPVTSGRGRKRKTDTETPATKSKKEAPAADDDTKEFSDYDSGNNETQPLRKKPKKEEKKEDSKESLTTKQQTAVAAALAAGVPGGQQRSVSCVADTNTQREVVVECFAPYDDHRR